MEDVAVFSRHRTAPVRSRSCLVGSTRPGSRTVEQTSAGKGRTDHDVVQKQLGRQPAGIQLSPEDRGIRGMQGGENPACRRGAEGEPLRRDAETQGKEFCSGRSELGDQEWAATSLRRSPPKSSPGEDGAVRLHCAGFAEIRQRQGPRTSALAQMFSSDVNRPSSRKAPTQQRLPSRLAAAPM